MVSHFQGMDIGHFLASDGGMASVGQDTVLDMVHRRRLGYVLSSVESLAKSHVRCGWVQGRCCSPSRLALLY